MLVRCTCTYLSAALCKSLNTNVQSIMQSHLKVNERTVITKYQLTNYCCTVYVLVNINHLVVLSPISLSKNKVSQFKKHHFYEHQLIQSDITSLNSTNQIVLASPQPIRY